MPPGSCRHVHEALPEAGATYADPRPITLGPTEPRACVKGYYQASLSPHMSYINCHAVCTCLPAVPAGKPPDPGVPAARTMRRRGTPAPGKATKKMPIMPEKKKGEKRWAMRSFQKTPRSP
jgi:hypothetical protein